MTAYMIDSITVTRTKVYKGAGRFVVSDPDLLTSFPGRLESIMQPSVPADGVSTAYELATGWIDLGPTTEDGMKIQREAALSDGIPLDQRTTNLDSGEPESWDMAAEATLLHTDLENIQKAWEGGTLRAYAGDASYVAQHVLDLDAPSSFTERMAAFIQEDPKSGKLRAYAFRSTIPQVDGSEMNLQSGEATGLPLKLKLNADETVSEGSGQFGKIYEED
uniref:Uncharacterized protein n=1 Tax=viral metagenome TaxID=1070528 RepID=A0A6M3X4R4_9ZZZZ